MGKKLDLLAEENCDAKELSEFLDGEKIYNDSIQGFYDAFEARMIGKPIKQDWTMLCSRSGKNQYGVFNINITTQGFEKYSGREVYVHTTEGRLDVVARMVNAFCRMYAGGEVFDEWNNHCLDEADGTTWAKFRIRYVRTKNRNYIILKPHFETEDTNTEEHPSFANNPRLRGGRE